MTGSRARGALAGRLVRFSRSDAANLVIVGLIAQAVTVVSGPLLARMLGAHGRGQLALVIAAALVCNQLALNSLGAGITRAVASRHRPARDVVGSLLRRWIAWSVLAALAAATCSAFYLKDMEGAIWLTVMTFLISFVGGVMALLRAMVRGENGMKAINRADLAITFGYVGLVIILFFAWHDAPIPIILATFLTGQLISLGIIYRGLQPGTGTQPDPAVRTEVHRFARQGYFASIGTLDRLGLDSLILGAMLGTAIVGQYSVAASIAALPALLVGRLAVAVLPRMSAQAPAEAAAFLRRWMIGALVMTVPVIALLWAVMEPLVRVLFGQEFIGTVWPSRYLLLANSAFAVRLILTAAVSAQGRERKGSAISLASTVVLLVALALGARLGGLTGAAIGVTAAAIAGCLAMAAVISWSGATVVTASRGR